MAFSLPYEDASYDRVISSLVFHHMTRDNKGKALLDAFRVLRSLRLLALHPTHSGLLHAAY